MELDSLEKSIFIFIFCSKNRKRITAIVWNVDGWLELTKKLECCGYGTYCWPKNEKEAEKVTLEDKLPSYNFQGYVLYKRCYHML